MRPDPPAPLLAPLTSIPFAHYRERLHLETTQKIDSLQSHIAGVEEKLDAAEQRLGRQKARHDDEMAALQDSLAKASVTSGAPVDEGSAEQKIADLEDHVERTSCTPTKRRRLGTDIPSLS